MKVVEVAGGLIHHDGRYLIARRKPGVQELPDFAFPPADRAIIDALQRDATEARGAR